MSRRHGRRISWELVGAVDERQRAADVSWTAIEQDTFPAPVEA
jgi:hypothetical protein